LLMCGIAAEIRLDGRPVDARAVERMTERQASRGPDSAGFFSEKRVALGHRRLKILDLSKRASQPMVDEDHGLVIVFNGCIYNFRELRLELEDFGHRFRTTSDTEVILKAYAEWGAACVERFNGMFAFVIYDRRSGRAFVARDRLGIKPLYLRDHGGALRFASSLPALLAAERERPEIDPVGLHHYMSFHSVVPAPHTILKGFEKVPPATRMLIEPDGSRTVEQYWSPAFKRNGRAKAGFAALKEQLLDALGQAVRRRMVADVPVGVLLSGGIDSSLVVGLLAQNGAERLETFSIGFESAGGEEGNEFAYSDLVARTFGTNHHKIEVGSRGLVQHLPACFSAMSEPMTSHDNIAFYLLSREVSQHVKVVQSGQGADEIFGGYFWYPELLGSEDALRDYSQAFFDRGHDEMQRVLEPGVLADDYSREFVARHFETASASRPVDKALHLDTTVMLVEDPVKRVDNMTMAFGLEARVPFLDHELVEIAAAVPPELKVAFGGKFVLKEAARSVLPSEVIDRKKGYFPVPELKYLDGPSLEFVEDALNSQRARERGLIRRNYIDRLLEAPAEHLTPLKGSKLWQIAALETWLQTHGI
jgi:asparagine synthase (glutamine-hydrolysing)